MKSIKVFLAFSAISCAWPLTAMNTPVKGTAEDILIEMIMKSKPVEKRICFVLDGSPGDDYRQELTNGDVIAVQRLPGNRFSCLKRRYMGRHDAELPEALAKLLFPILEKKFNEQEAAKQAIRSACSCSTDSISAPCPSASSASCSAFLAGSGSSASAQASAPAGSTSPGASMAAAAFAVLSLAAASSSTLSAGKK